MLAILKGGAKSGKDTVGEMMAAKRQGACIAQADPMKRFAHRVFDFNEETLWGPSAMRNVLVRDSEADLSLWWRLADLRFREHYHTLINEVLPERSPEFIARSANELETWFTNLRETFHDEISARVMLQTIGTEWGRLIDPDMWNKWAINAGQRLTVGGYTYTRMDGLMSDAKIRGPLAPNLVIITDGRFRNEVLGVRSAGGLAIQVSDPQADGQGPGIQGHPSEEEMKSIPDWWFHLTIVNDKRRGLQVLDHLVSLACHHLFPVATADWDDEAAAKLAAPAATPKILM